MMKMEVQPGSARLGYAVNYILVTWCWFSLRDLLREMAIFSLLYVAVALFSSCVEAVDPEVYMNAVSNF